MARPIYNRTVFLRMTERGSVTISPATSETPADEIFQPSEALALFTNALAIQKPLDRNAFWITPIELDKTDRMYSYAQASSAEIVSCRLVFNKWGAPQLQCFETLPKARTAKPKLESFKRIDVVQGANALALVVGSNKPAGIKRK